MTPQEAIEVLTDKHTSIGTTKCDDETWKKLRPAIEAAIVALEKQIPKKPVKRDNCGNESCVERCSNCFEVVHGAYCEYCGQSLQWEGFYEKYNQHV